MVALNKLALGGIVS